LKEVKKFAKHISEGAAFQVAGVVRAKALGQEWIQYV